MVGLPRPIFWSLWRSDTAKSLRRIGVYALIGFFVALAVKPTQVHAIEKTVRLRMAWGSNDTKKTKWTGQIHIDGATLSGLQPLGIETDAPVALRLDGSRVVVAPQQERGFDGCDVTVKADDQALVRIQLQPDINQAEQSIEIPLSQVISGQVRQALGSPGSFFVAHRAPGDRLRVAFARDNLVFGPGEKWNFALQPDLEAELAEGPIRIDLELRATGKNEILWQANRQLTPSTTLEQFEFEIECPEREDAYSLEVTARHQEGFATKWVPGMHSKVLESRKVDFVVINPQTQLPQLADRWQHVLTIDPANPSWWQRLPSWTKVPGLRERMSGATGNIRPVVRSSADGELVELPSALGSEPYWQSYTLPVRNPGLLHMVEVEYPVSPEQHMSISIVEPDAAGRVNGVNHDLGFYSVGVKVGQDGRTELHRFVFWPRTSSPQLLLVNQHPSGAAQYGKIRLLQQDSTVEGDTGFGQFGEKKRLVAGYVSRPEFTASVGAPEILDAASGLSIQSWSTFLIGTQRLVQYLRLNGQNTIFISVAADGSSLYPSHLLNPSPRYDSGLLAANGQDPVRKDVLEMFLRILDREGIQVVPTLQMATPLPRLELLRQSGDSRELGIEWISYQGNSWLEKNGAANGLAPHYNTLNGQVQGELFLVVDEILKRYGHHPSLGGVAIQLEGQGYAMLPDSSWGFDDSTIRQFVSDTGIRVHGEGGDRFRRRAEQLAGAQSQLWTNWRMKKLKQFYGEIGNAIKATRNDRRLFLTTESLFGSPALNQRVRKSLTIPENLQQALIEQGIDLARLDAHPGVKVFSPIRISPSAKLQQRAVDLRINTASRRRELFGQTQNEGQLLYQLSQNMRLPSFEQLSPFGANKTHMLIGRQALPVGYFQRQHLVTQLASRDSPDVVIGGPTLSLATHSSMKDILNTIQRLPDPESIVRTLKKQPVVVRVYRTSEGTTVAAINESPWPLHIRLPIETPQQMAWQAIRTGKDGFLPTGTHEWEVVLEPYDLQAWLFKTEKVQIREPSIALDELVREDLLQRIREVEVRTGNLDVQRKFSKLENPSFELQATSHRMQGWQPWLLGASGTVTLSENDPYNGKMSVRLKSVDQQGVALQSNSFAMPETGQLFVTVFLRAEKWADDARLQIAVEDTDGGELYRKYANLGENGPLKNEWESFELPLNDVPLNSNRELRIQFQLSGNAELFIDDVQLSDLRFDKGLRGSLVKRILAAKLALDNNHVVDCLQVMDDYWSRYLVEYVPPREADEINVASQPESSAPSNEQKEEKGISNKFKEFVPKIWR